MLRATRKRLGTIAIFMAMAASPAMAEMSHDDMKPSEEFDRKDALAVSQDALGNQVDDLRLERTDGSSVQLSDYRGKPLVVSFIFTSCFHICPTTTKHLDSVVKKAKDALGEDSFNVVTIGFDVMNDSPPRMKQFKKDQRVNHDNWHFLSGDKETIETLTEQMGFIYYRSPNGFDHLIQTTILNGKGEVASQLYGMNFEVPHLIEPLKRLVFGNTADTSLMQSVGNKIRLFCTVYDPARDHYTFDISVFVGLFIGILCVGAVGFVLVKEWRYTLKHEGRH